MPVPVHILELQQGEIRLALNILRTLPSLKLSEIGDEDSCAICLLPLDGLIKEDEAAMSEEGGGVEVAAGSSKEAMTGVVKLSVCGHVFCRKDLAEWVEGRHGTCPACRQAFFFFTPFDEDEYESSDGGEYIPDDDMDDEDIITDVDLLPTSDLDEEDAISGDDDVERGSWSRNREYTESRGSSPDRIPGPERAGVSPPNYRTHPYRVFRLHNGAHRNLSRHGRSASQERETDGSAWNSSPLRVGSLEGRPAVRSRAPVYPMRAAEEEEMENHEWEDWDGEGDDYDLPTRLPNSDGPSSEGTSLDTDEFDASRGGADPLTAAIMEMVQNHVAHALAGGFREIRDVNVRSRSPSDDLVTETMDEGTEVKLPRGETPAPDHSTD